MELARSNPYPVLSHNPGALRQAEAQAYVEQRLLELRQSTSSKIEGGDQRSITGRRRAPATLLDDAQKSTVHIVVQQSKPPAPKTISRPEQLPFGESSSAFLAQQLAQDTGQQLSLENTFQSAHSNVFERASSAYTDTRNLTVSILGLQGFRERLI
ncbi:hypothetical protein A9Q83_15240 [Alphaproteobacteria bacterium 46_93_T64]|nr:hypothetical protein A9Q83_15240 [Alphaproteobacteria bacterium 46_93_T64]